MPASRVTRYSEDGAKLAESVEFDLDGDMGTFSLHKVREGPFRVRWRGHEG